MIARRASVFILAALSVMVCAMAGYLAVRHFVVSGLPWDTTLAWPRMESLVGEQTIDAVAVRIVLEDGEGALSGEATLQVAHPGGDGSQVVLLLNPGLDIKSLLCDGVAVPSRRFEERLLVQLPSNTTTCELKLTYRGTLVAGNPAPLITSQDELLVDKLHFWYPVDLKSYSTLHVTALVPDDFEVAWSGNLLKDEVANGHREIQWAEARPVLAAGFAAGRYQRTSRVQGSIRCTIYGRTLDSALLDTWLADLGDSYNYFHSQFGSDGFNQINLVLSDSVNEMGQLGGPLIVSSRSVLEDPDAAFVHLAGQVARNWWGDTVSGRWFSSRPEAGEWLMSGLPEFSAWQALRTVKGRRSYLRYRESVYTRQELSSPLKTYNLDQRLRNDSTEELRALAVRGPCTVAAISQFIGPDAFARACRNFMSVHRYSTVSYAALLHEMTLASEKPMEELVRAWFDRPGSFDYAISNVVVEGGRAHVTIENRGDIPAFVPMELGILTEGGYQLHSLDVGVHGDTASFTVDGDLKRVVLDPEFSLGDMQRANNTWPTTQWPIGIAMSRNGQIAMLSQTEWCDDTERALQFFSLAGRTPEFSIAANARAIQSLQWNQSGRGLAVQSPEVAGYWDERQWHVCGGAGSIFLGWYNDEPVYWREGRIFAPGATASSENTVLLPAPLPGQGAVRSSDGRVAYVTAEHVLIVRDVAEATAKPVREDVRPIGGIRWRGESNELIYFEENGALVTLFPDTNQLTSILQRNYNIKQAKLSEGGGRVAWVDPAGLLRAVTPGASEPVYISLPGEVIDFSWEGEDALVAIVAAIPRRLPMRFHADFTLWRIPTSTWRGVQLPYDPVQFAAASSDTELIPYP